MIDIEISRNQTLDAMLHQILNQALVMIDAEAGSLMLVDNSEELLLIKARLGKPRKGRTSEPVFELNDGSVAGHVAKTCKSYLCRDIKNSNEEFFRPSRTGVNFRSILSVPVVNDEGIAIAVINADARRPDSFTVKHLETLEEVATIVANPIAEKVRGAAVLAEIGMDIVELTREGEADLLLQKIAEAAVKRLGADVVTLYQYNQENDEFLVEGTGPTVSGELRHPETMRTSIDDNDVPYIFVRKRESGFFPDVHRVNELSADIERPRTKSDERFIVREGIKSMAALLLPYRAAKNPDQEIVGIIFVNYREPHAFLNIDQRLELSTFADFAAATILTARFQEQRTKERVALVTSLSGGLAHRMSKLFAPSRLAAQYLRKRLPENDMVAHNLLNQIERQANLLFGLSDRMADRFKAAGTTYVLKNIDLKKEIDHVITSNDYQMHGIEIINHIDTEIPLVKCDPFQLRDILHDLIINSIDAINAIRSDDTDFTGTISFSAKPLLLNDPYVEVEISDNGCGIPLGQREEIFLPGSGTKGTLGIGLWWCQTFLRGIGGDILLKDPQPTSGATFVIKLPCLTKETTISSRKILIVEDDQTFIDVTKSILEENGYDVDAATNWNDAKKSVFSGSYPLILLDIALTDHDDKQGLDILSLIIKNKIRSRVIIATGVKKLLDFSELEKIPNIAGVFVKQEGEIMELIQLVNNTFDDIDL